MAALGSSAEFRGGNEQDEIPAPGDTPEKAALKRKIEELTDRWKSVEQQLRLAKQENQSLQALLDKVKLAETDGSASLPVMSNRPSSKAIYKDAAIEQGRTRTLTTTSVGKAHWIPPQCISGSFQDVIRTHPSQGSQAIGDACLAKFHVQMQPSVSKPTQPGETCMPQQPISQPLPLEQRKLEVQQKAHQHRLKRAAEGRSIIDKDEPASKNRRGGKGVPSMCRSCRYPKKGGCMCLCNTCSKPKIDCKCKHPLAV